VNPLLFSGKRLNKRLRIVHALRKVINATLKKEEANRGKPGNGRENFEPRQETRRDPAQNFALRRIVGRWHTQQSVGIGREGE
jgi:hypothetical protein